MHQTRLKGWVMVVVQLLLLAFLVLAPRQDHWRVSRPLQALGIVLELLGVVVIVLGAFSLGRSIRAHPEPAPNAELRTAGLYRFVRHPIYSGVLVFAAGLAITSGNLASVIAFAVLVAVLAIKARFEERLLEGRFAGYRRYADSIPRFFPLHWRGR
jgi:protein-S-isoprenylcysteine O-methyltransferase Ste14